MILDEPGNNVPLAAFHARRLGVLQALAPKDSLDAVLRPLLTNGFSSVFWPATNAVPATYIGGNAVRKILYIGGIPTTIAGAGFVQGYDNAEGGGTFRVYNSWVQNATNVIQQRFTVEHVQDSEYLDFVGYSVGGAIGTELMRRYVLVNSPIKRKLISFGAPRSHNTTDRTRLAASSITRWMTDADPVPLIPPRLTDAPALIATTNTLTLLRWGEYVHTDGGISISSNGSTIPATLPPVASLNVGSSLASWYFGAENDPNNPHAITTYIAWLTAAELLLTTPQVQTVEQGEAEVLDRPKRRQVNQAQERMRAAIHNAGRAQNGVPVFVPDVQLFRAVRLDRIWVVQLGDRVVIQSPREDRARHIARAGNDFLRSLPKQALVDPVALLDQLESFLALAASPDSGFMPTINTEIEV